jgi:hypothetical protein
MMMFLGASAPAAGDTAASAHAISTSRMPIDPAPRDR